jgi:hypothetical protein
MKNVVITLGAAVYLAGASVAHAQTVVNQPAQPPPVVVTQPAAQPPPQQTIVAVPPERERAVSTGPNPTLLMSGLFAFGVPYGISVVVAAESDRDGDKNLFIPVVGPWLAYANEGTCRADNISCGRSTGNKVLLAGDGIFQAIGAIEIAAAFMFASSPSATASSPRERRVMVAPSRMGAGGYGLAAAGTF